MGLAPHARIVVYEGPNDSGSPSNTSNYDTLAAAVDDDVAQVVTTSWGECEQLVGEGAAKAESVLFEQAALQGQSVVAAAGDSGSEDCYNPASSGGGRQLAVDDPASQPLVTGVGGTTLTLGSPLGETAWNTGLGLPDPGAGGGGLSAFWPMPAYQRQAAPGLGIVTGPYAGTGRCGSSGCREVPDVAADAGSAYAVYCTQESFDCAPGGWTPVGGTSAAAPTFAALLALADSSAACATTGPVGFVNPALYAAAGGSDYPTAFRDVTTGDNDLTGSAGGLYPAATGYDLATGLGAPLAGDGSDGGLVAQLCSAGSRAIDDAALAAPAVTAVRAGSGPAGLEVTVHGRDLAGARAVRFGLRLARFTVASPERILAYVPPGSGSVHVTVVGRRGTSRRTRADVFTYVPRSRATRAVPSGVPGRQS